MDYYTACNLRRAARSIPPPDPETQEDDRVVARAGRGPKPKFDRLPEDGTKPPGTLEEILFQGMYPRIHARGVDPNDWLGSYYRTYVERDVREVRNIGDLDAFQRFVRLCAGRTGQLVNLSSLAADCGISHTTARRWLSVLQAGFIETFVLSELYKAFANRGEAPPLYFWRDRTGHEVDLAPAPAASAPGAAAPVVDPVHSAASPGLPK